MNSFKLTAIGCLARNPELNVQGYDGTFARFCLVGHDDAIDEVSYGLERETVTSVWFIAFGELATEIASHARKGDQLFLEACVIAKNWTERGESQHGYAFVVTGFRFGARCCDPGAPAAERYVPPGSPPPPPEQAEAANAPVRDGS